MSVVAKFHDSDAPLAPRASDGPAPRVVQLCLQRDAAGRDPAELLRAWPTMTLVAEAAADAGCRVAVVQASVQRETLLWRGLSYRFGPWDRAGGPAADVALRQTLRELRPDVLHLHGLGFPEEVRRLRRLMPGVPLLVQDHADRPPPRWRLDRRWRQRGALAGAAGVLFCARKQAEPWRRLGLLPGIPVFEIAESSTDLAPIDRDEARRRTGLGGAPALLWVAHLDRNKDPLAVLDGVARASGPLPDLRLWCCFRDAPLLDAVRDRVARDPRLSGRVHLVGPVPHARIAEWMSAADLFVAGSHREGSGYALIEALACGLPPIVTDIPSHRMLTGEGGVGHLWPVGDSAGLAAGLSALWSPDAAARARRRAEVRSHFEHRLSRAALGRSLTEAYARVIARASGPG